MLPSFKQESTFFGEIYLSHSTFLLSIIVFNLAEIVVIYFRGSFNSKVPPMKTKHLSPWISNWKYNPERRKGDLLAFPRIPHQPRLFSTLFIFIRALTKADFELMCYLFFVLIYFTSWFNNNFLVCFYLIIFVWTFFSRGFERNALLYVSQDRKVKNNMW